MKDNRRELLKQLLQGTEDPEEVVKKLKREASQFEMVGVMLRADGTYTVEGQDGLTKEQMEAVVGDREVFLIKIRESKVPLAFCERDVVL
ncbi:hypothetical protein CLV24_104169 [Pontibacter ummariensis]|uniref:Uncharacterized protein n=1 Tax=Pontibacter ummariensis TaxID=1610492 RepID=A0A239DE05_9BACT|nr:hypothetical protein [Pontibacter ummariensis]PRY14359.1 hypothetical protein CLV24_104169 [Pontibacter ummariensis]SNS30074.1 hypothetical protein SAMN06296052_104168 [Pontibacter ummariensis]